MKRMDEVFELPLSRMVEADDQIQDANGDWALVVRLPHRADYAAHAINHVDALADALEALLKELDSTYIGSANLSDRIHGADAALAAYRGDK